MKLIHHLSLFLGPALFSSILSAQEADLAEIAGGDMASERDIVYYSAMLEKNAVPYSEIRGEKLGTVSFEKMQALKSTKQDLATLKKHFGSGPPYPVDEAMDVLAGVAPVGVRFDPDLGYSYPMRKSDVMVAFYSGRYRACKVCRGCLFFIHEGQ